jgi:hypothetical protein
MTHHHPKGRDDGNISASRISWYMLQAHGKQSWGETSDALSYIYIHYIYYMNAHCLQQVLNIYIHLYIYIFWIRWHMYERAYHRRFMAV